MSYLKDTWLKLKKKIWQVNRSTQQVTEENPQIYLINLTPKFFFFSNQSLPVGGVSGLQQRFCGDPGRERHWAPGGTILWQRPPPQLFICSRAHPVDQICLWRLGQWRGLSGCICQQWVGCFSDGFQKVSYKLGRIAVVSVMH